MRICLIMEGSYPYVRGGVSSWTHELISAMPEHEFVIWAIGALEESRGKFRYTLPANVVEVREIFLDEALKLRARKNSAYAFTTEESEEIHKLFLSQDPDWDVLFNCYSKKNHNPVEFLMSEQFLELLKELCRERYPFASFSALFYTVRSMFLPLMHLMGAGIPEADIYHSTAAGYGSVLGAMGAWKFHKPFLLTEHGIYTREREEEILRSKWVAPEFRDLWISLFHVLSRCAYSRADRVTSLFSKAMATQIDLGCKPEKCLVIRNGIKNEEFEAIPLKEPDGMVDIGAVVRVVPIKDIKTMIYAFANLQSQIKKVRLHIIGDLSDTEYSGECTALVHQLGLTNVLFVGETNVRQYLSKLDFTILSSISEGQPLAVIESMAARRPCVVTNVGACRELVEGGADDTYGAAGICVPPMHTKALTDAMTQLCQNPGLRLAMGEAGRQRVRRFYSQKEMVANYNELYERALSDGGNRV